MLQMIGHSSHSASNLDNLLTSIQARCRNVLNIRAEYRYFIEIDEQYGLSSTNKKVIQTLLEAKIHISSDIIKSEFLLLVTPRPGSISPWSSKATNIIHNIGIDNVLRIERGIAFFLDIRKYLTIKQCDFVSSLIHDRMTESVFYSEDEANHLFIHGNSRPLLTIDVLNSDRSSLVAANENMGLALSDNEIDYVFDNFVAMGRNPNDIELMMFAQANSEHCRHKIFKSDWIIDGQKQLMTLFNIIRNTYVMNPVSSVMKSRKKNNFHLKSY